MFCLDTRVVSGFYGYCRTSGELCCLIIFEHSGFGTKISLLPLRINAAGAPWNILVSASVTFLPSRLFVRILDLTRTFTGTGFRSAPQDTSSKVLDIILTLQDVWRLKGWGSMDVPGYPNVYDPCTKHHGGYAYRGMKSRDPSTCLLHPSMSRT